MNKAIIIGRLGRDPELKQAQSGKSICRLAVATDDGFGDKKVTSWHNITVFDKQADNCAKFLAKGSMVCVEGRISYDTYEKNGEKRTSTSIIASNVQFIGSKSEGQSQPKPEAPKQSPQSDFGQVENIEEIPF